MHRKFTSDRIFTGSGWAPENSVLLLDDQNMVIDILPVAEAGPGIEKLDGIICPGFINAHVHLELSHMKGLIPRSTGLVNFLLEVVKKRGFEENVISSAMAAAEEEMWVNGIVAAGDICNTADSRQVKSSSRICWKNFIEVLNLHDEKAKEAIAKYTGVAGLFQQNSIRTQISSTSLSPHSPYSVSPATFALINESTAGQTISMHNQESGAENELYISGNGDFLKLYQFFGLKDLPLHVTGKSSLQSIIPFFNKQQRIILVHNTFTTEQDIDVVMEHAENYQLQIFFCLCPNANLYIESKLPDVKMLLEKNVPIALGTDSYSSNQQLSIAAEVAAIHNHFPEIDLSVILGWATFGGAQALGVADEFGSFEKGKKPGVLLLNDNFEVLRLV
jgi:cytosine/adenosine deaminase-related metal-dependent hydrolase